MTNLKFFRLERHLSQRELARRLRVSQPLLSQIETGARRPYPKILRESARVLDVPLSALAPDLGGKEDEN